MKKHLKESIQKRLIEYEDFLKGKGSAFERTTCAIRADELRWVLENWDNLDNIDTAGLREPLEQEIVRYLLHSRGGFGKDCIECGIIPRKTIFPRLREILKKHPETAHWFKMKKPNVIVSKAEYERGLR